MEKMNGDCTLMREIVIGKAGQGCRPPACTVIPAFAGMTALEAGFDAGGVAGYAAKRKRTTAPAVIRLPQVKPVCARLT